MSNPIVPLASIAPLAPLGNIEKAKAANLGEGTDFSSFLKEALNGLDKTQQEADQAAVALVTGQTDDFHTPIIAMEKANLALGLAVDVRNKVLDAYHEIMRMQI